MGTRVTSASTFQATDDPFALASSINGEWVTVVTRADDSVAGSVQSAVLLNPRTYSSDPNGDKHRPLIVNFGTRVRFQTTRIFSTATLSESGPTVRVYGANFLPDSTGAYPSGTLFWRLDGATFTAAGTQLPFDDINDQRNNNGIYYGTPTSNDGYLLRGAKSVLTLVATDSNSVSPLSIAAQVI